MNRHRPALVIEDFGGDSLDLLGLTGLDLTRQMPLQMPFIGLLNCVLRTQKSIVLKDATTDEAFSHDPYIQQTQPRSVLCLSLVNRGKLNGIIYLENNLMTNAFTQDRLNVLQLLSSQAAISLENAQLYSQLQQYSQTLEEKVAERTSELEQVNKVLHQQATIDGLTQLTNRRGFDQALERDWQRLMRSRQSLSLLLCDVDHFKAYNDHYGHLEDDQCLQHIAKALQAAAQRQTDTIARYGGEEFVLILPDTALPAAVLLAEKVRSRIEQLQIPHAASPAHRCVTISIGVTRLIPHAETKPETLIAAADQALYAAKSAGRNTHSVVIKNKLDSMK
jgi:diguanylate cyclase (GGDEF)-like protein